MRNFLASLVKRAHTELRNHAEIDVRFLLDEHGFFKCFYRVTLAQQSPPSSRKRLKNFFSVAKQLIARNHRESTIVEKRNNKSN